VGEIGGVVVPDREGNTYRVLFLDLADKTTEGRRKFTEGISGCYHIPPGKVEFLVANPPVVIKRGLSLAKAQALAEGLTSIGGRVQLIAEAEPPLLELEYAPGESPLLRLESPTSSLRGGMMEVTGRVRNISSHPLRGVRVVAQFFDARNQFITYEDSPIAFSFLNPDQFSPFKVMSEGNSGVGRISFAFKGEDGTILSAQIDRPFEQKAPPPEGNHQPKATAGETLKPTGNGSHAIDSFLEKVFSKISKDTFTQADVEEVLREMFAREWALLEKKYEGVEGGSARRTLANILSWYAQRQGSIIQTTGTFVDGPPGYDVPKMALYRKLKACLPSLARVSPREFDGQSPLKNIACPSISQKSSSSIARAIIKGYNEEKIPHDLRNFNHLGFNARSLVSEEDTLVRFLSLVFFDRWPFQPWEMVWDEEGGSIHAVLRSEGLFHTGEIRKASLDEIESRLRRCSMKGGLGLHADGWKIRFAVTLKELSLHVGSIASLMKSASTESDLMFLHESIMNIHGFNAPISARCIAYAMRELGAGRASPGMFEPIAQHLKEQWRASDWGQRLEFPLLGGRPHLFNEIMEHLTDDALAFDYLSLVGADYCQDGHCEHCSLS
jgi:hypothetical protein